MMGNQVTKGAKEFTHLILMELGFRTEQQFVGRRRRKAREKLLLIKVDRFSELGI
jgi:hypothetical protein